MGIKSFIARHVESIFNEIQERRDQEQRKQFSAAASFDAASVRIDNTAVIANNRSDKRHITIGNDTWIKGELLTYKHGGEIKIGKWCFVGEGSRIWSSVKVQVGDNVLISHNVNIADNSSHPLNAEERHADFMHIKTTGLQEVVNIDEAPIIIGDNAWIGFNATILKGVTIGEGAIIGAHTVITKDVPAFAVVVGSPPRIVKYTT